MFVMLERVVINFPASLLDPFLETLTINQADRHEALEHEELRLFSRGYPLCLQALSVKVCKEAPCLGHLQTSQVPL